MALDRKSKPKWFLLLNRIKAINEVGMGNSRDLANYLGIADQRISEWLNFKQEPKADRVIRIQDWIRNREAAIACAGKLDEYRKLLKRLGKS